MADFTKLSKRSLIDNITTFYLKNGETIQDNIRKISKQKLIDIITDNNIPIYNDNKLIAEIKETEDYTAYLEIIYYNYIKYHNINYDIIYNIKINPHLTSNDLRDIIQKYNLIIDVDVESHDDNSNKMIINLCHVAKLKKKYLIDNITAFYFKKGQTINNIHKISKDKLINLMINNNIPIIDKKKLKSEIKEKELYTTNLNIIYHNFMKYKNIDYAIINDIKNNTDLTSDDLENIIDKYNLIIDTDDEIKKTNKLIIDLSSAYNSYYDESSNSESNKILEFKTLPDIIKCLEFLISH